MESMNSKFEKFNKNDVNLFKQMQDQQADLNQRLKKRKKRFRNM